MLFVTCVPLVGKTNEHDKFIVLTEIFIKSFIFKDILLTKISTKSFILKEYFMKIGP